MKRLTTMTDRLMSEMVRNQRPLTLREDATIAEACRQMHERRVGAVMVTNADGNLLGIFTGRDAVRILAQGCAADGRVDAAMTRSPDTMPPGRPAIDALRLMQDGGFRHLPVVDGGSLGVISALRSTTGSTLKSTSGSASSHEHSAAAPALHRRSMETSPSRFAPGFGSYSPARIRPGTIADLWRFGRRPQARHGLVQRLPPDRPAGTDLGQRRSTQLSRHCGHVVHNVYVGPNLSKHLARGHTGLQADRYADWRHRQLHPQPGRTTARLIRQLAADNTMATRKGHQCAT